MAKYLDSFKDLQKIQRPKYLYKYRKANQYTIDMLENDYLWCTSVEEYNDPYEGHFNTSFLIFFKNFIGKEIKDNVSDKQYEYFMNIKTEEELLKHIEMEFHFFDSKEIKNVILKYKNYLKTKNDETRQLVKRSYKICSLSEHYDNILMWSHYANFHKGVCLKYNTEDLKKYLYKVNYSANVLELTNIIRADKTIGDLFVQLVMTTKNSVWEYENEWRIVVNQKLIKDNKYTIAPISIYLGTDITKQSKNRFIKKAKEKNIEIYELKMDDAQYKLIPKKID